MRIQLLSDLHLETESFEPKVAPDADILILAGDIDSGHVQIDRFKDWPVPVIYIPGNHEYDHKDFDQATDALRERCDRLGFTMLDCEQTRIEHDGRTIRVLGTTLWNDFELFGPGSIEHSMRAARYFAEQVQCATRNGKLMGVPELREEGLRCREWLREQLTSPEHQFPEDDATLVITHFAPSLRSNDSRYPVNASSASFCNAYDDMIPHSTLWVHGHLHCRHDYTVGASRVVCNSRGMASKGEDSDFQPMGVWNI
jgi:hypothetical protein